MPSLDKLATQPIKLMMVGDPGSGKTGSLAPLADAGYNLRIYDLDNGVPILFNYLRSPNTPYNKEAWRNVRYQTITENNVNLSTVVGTAPRGATVLNRLFTQLNHWKTEEEDLGPINSWGPKDILVIDSFTLMGRAALNFAQLQNIGAKDNRVNYFHAQDLLENVAMKLYGTDVKCHVVINTHISWIGDEADKTLHGYPMTIGRALSSKIGRYFNTILLMKSVGNQRKIHTRPFSSVELKSSAPLNLRDSYDIKFGMAEIFRDLQGQSNAKATDPQTP